MNQLGFAPGAQFLCYPHLNEKAVRATHTQLKSLRRHPPHPPHITNPPEKWLHVAFFAGAGLTEGCALPKCGLESAGGPTVTIREYVDRLRFLGARRTCKIEVQQLRDDNCTINEWPWMQAALMYALRGAVRPRGAARPCPAAMDNRQRRPGCLEHGLARLCMAGTTATALLAGHDGCAGALGRHVASAAGSCVMLRGVAAALGGPHTLVSGLCVFDLGPLDQRSGATAETGLRLR